MIVVLLDRHYRAVQFNPGHASQSRRERALSELCVSFWEGLARKVNALHLKPAGTTLSSVVKTVIIQQGHGAKHCSQTACLQGISFWTVQGWGKGCLAPMAFSHLTYLAKPDFICKEWLQSLGLPESQMCHGNFPLIKWNMNLKQKHLCDGHQLTPYLLGTAVKFEKTYRAIISRQVSVSSRWRFFKLSSAWATEFSSAEPRLELVMDVCIRLEENVSNWQITLQNACPCHPKDSVMQNNLRYMHVPDQRGGQTSNPGHNKNIFGSASCCAFRLLLQKVYFILRDWETFKCPSAD